MYTSLKTALRCLSPFALPRVLQRPFKLYSLLNYSFAILTLASSCSDESEVATPDNDMVSATFSSGISGSITGTTRVIDQVWSGDEVVGICMLSPAGGSLPSDAVFSQYKPTSSSGGESVNLEPTTREQTVFFPYEGTYVDFIAFSPNQAPATGMTAVYAITDQSTSKKVESADFIWTTTKGTTGAGTYNKHNRTVPLTFYHKQSKIIINVTAGEGVTADDMADPALTIQGIPTKGTYSLADGTLTAAETSGTVTPYRTALNASGTPPAAKWEGILVPHLYSNTSFQSRKIVVTTAGNKSVSYPLPTTSQSFEQGKSYTYNLTLTHTSIVLNNITIEDWNATRSITYGTPSNSYILKPGGHTVAIPVSRINEFKAGTLGKTDTFTASLLWNDGSLGLVTVSAGGTGYKDYIYVTSASSVDGSEDKVGNAVIIAKNSSGTILWSWHVWVTDYEPTSTTAGTFMNRNLGATSGTATDGVKTFGLYYQWGRKDPFPRSASYETTAGEPTLYNAAGSFKYSMNTGVVAGLGCATRTANDTRQSIDWSIANPATFITNKGSWFPSPTATDDPWSATGSKSLYDPCPQGWRVPANGVWSALANEDANPDWDTSYKGATFSSYGGWYPAAGCRYATSGELNSVGGNGYFWSATVDTAMYTFYLFFHSNTVKPGVYIEQSAGLAVRCVSE